MFLSIHTRCHSIYSSSRSEILSNSRMKSSPKANEALWFKDAIIYEVSVRAFYDGDGDGIGDFQGLIEKLD